MAKYWKYTPNAVTTRLWFTIHFDYNGGTVANTTPPYKMYLNLNKNNGNWVVAEAIVKDQDDNVVNIENSVRTTLYRNDNEGNIIIKWSNDYAISKIECECGKNDNGERVDVQQVVVKRIKFLEIGTEYGQIEPGIINGLGQGNGTINRIDMSTLEDRNDIVFSNLTDEFVLPGLKQDDAAYGAFNGWGIINPKTSNAVYLKKANIFWMRQVNVDGQSDYNNDWKTVKRKYSFEDSIADKANFYEGGFQNIYDFDAIDDELYLALPLIYSSGPLNYTPTKNGDTVRTLESIYDELNPTAAAQQQS